MPDPTAPRRSASGHELTPPDAELRTRLEADLNEEERRVLLRQGTEPPFCGGLLHEHRIGEFTCRLCGLPLFAATSKFESGSGWPSFFAPIDPDHIRQLDDRSHGMRRTEIRCGRCDSHLGHVFEDGPPPTGLRYCLNSISLRFIPAT